MSNETDPNQSMAHHILYELWYSIAETLFQRACIATELDPEQTEALRRVMLRPNDFQIHIDDEPM